MFTTTTRSMWETFLLASLITLPFILLNVYHTNKNSSCTSIQMAFPSMPLATWLLLDALVRTIMLFILLIIAIVTNFRDSTGHRMFRHYRKLVLVCCIFEVVWMIFGVITFFMRVMDECSSSGFIIYLIILLSMTLLYAIYVICIIT